MAQNAPPSRGLIVSHMIYVGQQGYGDSHEERGFSLANLSLAVDGDRLKLW